MFSLVEWEAKLRIIYRGNFSKGLRRFDFVSTTHSKQVLRIVNALFFPFIFSFLSVDG